MHTGFTCWDSVKSLLDLAQSGPLLVIFYNKKYFVVDRAGRTGSASTER